MRREIERRFSCEQIAVIFEVSALRGVCAYGGDSPPK